jgi:hypothetical protein
VSSDSRAALPPRVSLPSLEHWSRQEKPHRVDSGFQPTFFADRYPLVVQLAKVAVDAGIAPFLVLDVLKVAAAAMILPQAWRLLGRRLG